MNLFSLHSLHCPTCKVMLSKMYPSEKSIPLSHTAISSPNCALHFLPKLSLSLLENTSSEFDENCKKFLLTVTNPLAKPIVVDIALNQEKMNTKEYEDSEITFNHVVTFVDAAQVDPLAKMTRSGELFLSRVNASKGRSLAPFASFRKSIEHKENKIMIPFSFSSSSSSPHHTNKIPLSVRFFFEKSKKSSDPATAVNPDSSPPPPPTSSSSLSSTSTQIIIELSFDILFSV
eukprot:TRINITY_DN7170_c0_g1_i1.p1 TRINITY_DN7170_c0_g1~~TRINITY_DN7170_c0_g1_i1.p1  ORF type:complete len:232 (+),score=93.32 TRINITY_DN7170_c0_g1_i1:500-1195(+)